MHHISEERLEKINEFMKNVSSITSGSESLYDENDILTKWDSVYYNITKYNDGTEKKDYSKPSKPSIMFHEIDEYLKTWSFKFNKIVDGFNKTLYYNGYKSFFRIDWNNIHKDMIKFDNHNWFNYNKEHFQKLIENKIIEDAKKTNNVSLLREIKIKSLLK